MSRARLWTSDFVVAFATLVVLKLALLLENVRASEGFEPPKTLLRNAHLVLGHDAVGAAALATLLSLSLPPALRQRPWARRTALLVQGSHALFATASAWSLLLLGGWISKAGLDSAFQQSETGMQALTASLGGLLSGAVVASLCLLPGLAVLLGHVAPRRISGARPVVPRLIVGVACSAYLATALWLPTRTAARSKRLYTNNLERSALSELALSYARPLLRARAARHDAGVVVSLESVTRKGGLVESPLGAARPEKTNLLVVLLESVGAAYVERDPSPMPALRGLAHEPSAVRLESHYTTWSLTTKAVFSLLSSELPYPEALPETYVNPRLPCATLSQTLHDAGYFTAFVSSQDFAWERQLAFLRGRGFDVLWDKGSLPDRAGAWSAPWGIDDRVTVRALFGLLRKHRDRPFFGLVQLVAGHHPYVTDADQEEPDKADREPSYLRAIRVADDRLRDLLDGLRSEGLLERTLLLVVADHGESHVPGQGRNLYEVVARVPAVLLGPQTAGTGGAIHSTTSHVDLAPTLLGLLGVPVPCSMKGRNLTRPSTERLALLGGRPPAFQVSAVDGKWKYVLENDQREDLFALGAGGEVMAEPGGPIFDALRARVSEYRDASRALLEEYGQYTRASACPPLAAAAPAGAR